MEVKMHKFLVCAYNSQDFKQTQENYAQLHNRETVTFRNSGTRGPSVTRMRDFFFAFMYKKTAPGKTTRRLLAKYHIYNSNQNLKLV